MKRRIVIIDFLGVVTIGLSLIFSSCNNKSRHQEQKTKQENTTGAKEQQTPASPSPSPNTEGNVSSARNTTLQVNDEYEQMRSHTLGELMAIASSGKINRCPKASSLIDEETWRRMLAVKIILMWNNPVVSGVLQSELSSNDEQAKSVAAAILAVKAMIKESPYPEEYRHLLNNKETQTLFPEFTIIRLLKIQVIGREKMCRMKNVTIEESRKRGWAEP